MERKIGDRAADERDCGPKALCGPEAFHALSAWLTAKKRRSADPGNGRARSGPGRSVYLLEYWLI